MSTITTWSTTAASNEPQDSDPIPFPADQTTDLGFVLRDRKAVMRQESLNRGWEPDTRAATYASTSTFTTAGDLRAVYPTGTALRAVLAGGTVYTWVKTITYSSPNSTVTITGTVLTNPITSVQFSAHLPGSTAHRLAIGYPLGVGSPFPLRVTQWARFRVTNPSTEVSVNFLRPEPDDDYQILLQAVNRIGAGPSNNAYEIIDITARNEFGFTIEFGGASGVTSIDWEYCIVRGG